jgi:hypothetical protein
MKAHLHHLIQGFKHWLHCWWSENICGEFPYQGDS